MFENIPIVEIVMGIVIAGQNLYLAIRRLWKKNR